MHIYCCCFLVILPLLQVIRCCCCCNFFTRLYTGCLVVCLFYSDNILCAVSENTTDDPWVSSVIFPRWALVARFIWLSLCVRMRLAYEIYTKSSFITFLIQSAHIAASKCFILFATFLLQPLSLPSIHSLVVLLLNFFFWLFPLIHRIIIQRHKHTKRSFDCVCARVAISFRFSPVRWNRYFVGPLLFWTFFIFIFAQWTCTRVCVCAHITQAISYIHLYLSTGFFFRLDLFDELSSTRDRGVHCPHNGHRYHRSGRIANGEWKALFEPIARN